MESLKLFPLSLWKWKVQRIQMLFILWEHPVTSRVILEHPFILMHLTDAFIQSNLCIQAIHFYCMYVCSLVIEPTAFALLTQCSTTEPQKHFIISKAVYTRFYECISFISLLFMMREFTWELNSVSEWIKRPLIGHYIHKLNGLMYDWL